MEELRADLRSRLGAGDADGSGGGSHCVQEAGSARLVFAADGASFAGLFQSRDGQESFLLQGRIASASMDLDHASSSSSLPSAAAIPAISSPDGPPSTSYDVSVLDRSSDTSFVLKGVQLRSESAPGRVGFVWLDSDELRFETEELLAGPRAEAELQLGGFGALPLPLNGAVQMHLGTLSINRQTALTPPPTPSSVVDATDADAEMEMDFDR